MLIRTDVDDYLENVGTFKEKAINIKKAPTKILEEMIKETDSYSELYEHQVLVNREEVIKELEWRK